MAERGGPLMDSHSATARDITVDIPEINSNCCSCPQFLGPGNCTVVWRVQGATAYAEGVGARVGGEIRERCGARGSSDV